MRALASYIPAHTYHPQPLFLILPARPSKRPPLDDPLHRSSILARPPPYIQPLRSQPGPSLCLVFQSATAPSTPIGQYDAPTAVALPLSRRTGFLFSRVQMAADLVILVWNAG
ncbi:unnamed protein product [Cyclocybe aegerita]|uniref:Uncharacterized protein n=1 Tax=Cyclocybe aegerita TaxID=1973307 RepID=A0A8S0VZN3_CYCAE|nr:unnamed protein product [Cyclocybe aegerita]